MQSLHAVGQLIFKGLVTTFAGSRICCFAFWAMAASFACSVKTAFQGILATDLHRIKESYLRRLDAEADILEAEARCKAAESQKKFVEAISAASRINSKTYKRAVRMIEGKNHMTNDKNRP